MRLRLVTMSVTALVLAGFLAAPGSIAEHRNSDWGNHGTCDATLLQMTSGTVFAGEYCALAGIGFWSGTHIDLETKPLTGYDVRSVNLSFFAYEAEYEAQRGWNSSAEPVWSCDEGYVNGVYDECPPMITGGVDLEYGDYIAVMRIDVNQTEIAPTVGGVTVPTGLFLSGGTYGFQIWYNHR